MALPMVRQIKRNIPDVRVAVVAQINAMAEPFRRVAEVDETFVTGKGTAGILKGIGWTRRQHADAYVVPFPSNRWQYNLLAAASGAGRVVMHSYPIGRMSTLTFLSGADRVPAQRGIHDVVQNVRLLRLLGIEPDESERPEFVLNESDRTHAAELLRSAGLNDDARFIVVHAGSAKTILAQAKRWPPENYARLIELMCSELSHQIVLVEGPDEAGVAEEITRTLTPALSDSTALIAGRGTGRGSGVAVIRLTGPLGDAAALLERAELYVGSDSGLAHLAAAVGTPAVTLFAPADPDRVCPFGYRHLVVQPPRDCSPCFLYPWEATKPKMRCREPMCINFITVDMVMSKVREALAPSPLPSGEAG
jgi:ADP-heptose:LPS heptosyltransferase